MVGLALLLTTETRKLGVNNGGTVLRTVDHEEQKNKVFSRNTRTLHGSPTPGDCADKITTRCQENQGCILRFILVSCRQTKSINITTVNEHDSIDMNVT